MKKQLLIIALFLTSFTFVIGQETNATLNNKLDIGLFLGLSQNGSDTQSWAKDGESILNQAQLAYGLNLKYNIDESFGLRLNYWGSKIKGEDVAIENEFANGHDTRNFSFSSNLSEISLVGLYEFGGNKRWKRTEVETDEVSMYDRVSTNNGYEYRGFRKSVTPYIFGGLGFSFTNPQVDWNDQDNAGNAAIQNDIQNVGKTYFQVPLGIGLNFDLSEMIYLGLEASARIPLTDYLDGISEAANPEKNDAYQFAGINLGIRLNGQDNDMDNDGIKDNLDACPNVPGSSKHQGCPDSDNDGVTDKMDACPNTYGLPALKGCPDSDNDGIMDKDDACPETPGTSTMKGCPDSDGDGVADNLDKCPNEAGSTSNSGCPDNDTDNDGFTNDVDECPTIKGTMNGCPDADGDKIVDAKDPCPTVYGTFNGCPDSDGDGIADNLDKCPNQKGVSSNNGCPATRTRVTTTTTSPVVETQEEKIRIINSYRIRDLHFNTNSAGLTDESKIRIDEIIAFSIRYPEANFHIAGYTDNIGSADANQRLSKRRASMVYNTLIARGISSSRMSYEGYGETEFIDTNDTETGRYNNRRVEVRANIAR